MSVNIWHTVEPQGKKNVHKLQKMRNFSNKDYKTKNVKSIALK